MAETTEFLLSYKDLATSIVKFMDLHEGIWGLHFKFGIGGANASFSQNEITPTAFVPILGVGLRKFDQEDSISVDAARVNPIAEGPVTTELRGILEGKK